MTSKSTSDQGAKTQEYFVYFKFLQRRDGVNLPSGAEVVLISVYFILFFNKTIKNRFIACEPSGSQAKAQCAFEEAVQYQSRAKQLLCSVQ